MCGLSVCPKIAGRCRMWFNRNAGTGVMTMTMPTRRPREEVVRLGRELYQRDVLPQVQADHFGEYAAIDVETGDWAVANTEREALQRLRALRPGAVDVLDGAGRIPGAAQLWRRVSAKDRMIQGVVNAAYEAVVILTLQGPAGQVRDIEAVVDTGYSGFLTLPTAVVAELELPFAYVGQAFLANDDGSEFRRSRGYGSVGRTTAKH